MNPSEGQGADDRLCYHADPEATPHELMNEATEWLQYARGLNGLLADLIHESDTLDCQRVALALEAIGALMRMGIQCTAQAHVRMSWAAASPITEVPS